eukprot:6214046-Pleurochrysis_carterae.AAC.2
MKKRHGVSPKMNAASTNKTHSHETNTKSTSHLKLSSPYTAAATSRPLSSRPPGCHVRRTGSTPDAYPGSGTVSRLPRAVTAGWLVVPRRAVQPVRALQCSGQHATQRRVHPPKPQKWVPQDP